MALFSSWNVGHRKIAKDAINKIKKRRAKRSSHLITLPTDPLEWIEKARPTVEGKRRTFLTAPFWKDIYMDDYHSKIIVGGRQIYKSTYISDMLACEATSSPGIQVGYVTFNQSSLTGFSKQKLQIGTFSQNPVLSKFPRNKLGNMGEISLKNGSTIYCMTDNNQYIHVEGKSLNHCILDEAQYQDIEHLEKVRQTMMATKGKMSILGLGGEFGSPYEKLWKRSDQREWVYDNHNWRDMLRFDSNGLVVGDYLEEVLSGRWVPQNTENAIYHGYHLPQTIFATNALTIDDSTNKYRTSPFYSIEYQEKNNSKSYFTSHVMGKFYRSEGRPITPEMVLSCMNPYRYLGLMEPHEIAMWKDVMKDSIKISMGVDFGSGNPSSTVISILIHWKKYDRIQLAYIDKRPSENQLDQTEHINELFRASRWDIGVGDLGYGAIQVKTIQDGGANRTSGRMFPGVGSENFYGCRSISNESKPMQIHRDKIDEHGEETGRILIDKTSQIQKFIDLIETSRHHPRGGHPRSKFMIPFSASREYETEWLISELCSVTRKDLKKDLDTRLDAKKEFNHPKDSMMSIIYGLVGLEQDTEWHYISA
ncbi:hypothetical protein NKOR_00575 [Candidatus Nitrosopumilus koreensis AR1]|uniref:Terminase large subunit gp17-like C-terminal domain-containing protein n=1 Tax=Candidatus Nitrosopumilus koreensis AR1 TaxID=1229908 RepID=K0B1Z4_9ARCH|nr:MULTISPECIES: hypothetical protein [Nitrosopumilus]AFS80033.1 hypothetical protein NKOR_00575 [Candidatus Nitrosopumilus koreensis AR1]